MKNTFFTEEIQTFINNSCLLITGSFFKKWVDFANDNARISRKKDAGLHKLFHVLQSKVNQFKFESLLKLHKYKILV